MGGMVKYIYFIALTLLVSGLSFGSSKHTAKLVKYYGKVLVFKKSSKKKVGKGPFAKVKKVYYTVVKPKRGMA